MAESRLNVRIDPELRRQVKLEAIRSNIVVSDLVRDLLSEWLEQRLAERAREQKIK